MDAPAAQNKVTEDLRGFLTNPPVIANLVAEVLRADTNGQMVGYFVQIRYQTNGFFYREAPDLAGLSSHDTFPNRRLAGYYNDEYWSFSGGTLQYVTNATPSMIKTLDFVLEQASLLLHLGVFGVRPGDLVVDGTQFRSLSNNFGVVLEGRLVLGADSSPAGLEFSAEFNGTNVPWKADYSFDAGPSLPKFIPSRIQLAVLRDGNARPALEARLLSLELGDAPLPRAAFVPDDFTARTLNRATPSSNGAWTMEHTVTKEIVPAAPTAAAPGRPSPVRSRAALKATVGIFLILGCLAVAVIAATILRRFRQNQ